MVRHLAKKAIHGLRLWKRGGRRRSGPFEENENVDTQGFGGRQGWAKIAGALSPLQSADKASVGYDHGGEIILG